MIKSCQYQWSRCPPFAQDLSSRYGSTRSLGDLHERISPMSMSPKNDVILAKKASAEVLMDTLYIRQLGELGIEDISSVGTKIAGMGEMLRNLSHTGVKIPDGFAVVGDAFGYFLRAAKLHEKIKEILKQLNPHDLQDIHFRGSQIRNLFHDGKLPCRS